MLPYALSAATVAAATAVRYLLDPLLGDSAPLLIFTGAVAVAAAFGGFWPGVFAICLSAVVRTLLLIGSLNAIPAVEYLRLAIFFGIGFTISAVSERLRRALQTAGRNAAKLQESEEQYRLLVSGVADYGIFAMDVDGIITSWNTGAERIKGYTAEQAVGQHFSIFYTEEDRTAGKPRGNLERALTEGQFVEEGWREGKDGRRFWAEVSITALRNSAGRLRGFTKVTRDLTERKLAQEAQARSEAHIRALLESAAQGILSVDAEGRIVIANAMAEQMFGYDRTELIGAQVELLVPVLHRDRHTQERHDYYADPSVRPMGTGRDLSGRRKDGSEFPIEVSLSYFDSAAGRQAVAFISDITTRKRNEEQLRAMATSLEHRVRDRTQQLQEVNQELESFSYSVSHDLRAPLRTIEGFSRILLRDHSEALNGTARNYLQRMGAASVRMAQLIDDLLRLSRIARAPVEQHRVHLSSIAVQIVEEFRSRDSGRDIDVLIEPDVVANADENLVRIALENLLGNAWKFTSNTADARIEFGSMTRDGKQTYFVRDNGAGFDMQYASVLFTPFQRLHSADEFEGTGIGLAIVQRVIRRHGGLIEPESEPGKGTTMYFTLN